MKMYLSKIFINSSHNRWSDTTKPDPQYLPPFDFPAVGGQNDALSNCTFQATSWQRLIAFPKLQKVRLIGRNLIDFSLRNDDVGKKSVWFYLWNNLSSRNWFRPFLKNHRNVCKMKFEIVKLVKLWIVNEVRAIFWYLVAMQDCPKIHTDRQMTWNFGSAVVVSSNRISYSDSVLPYTKQHPLFEISSISANIFSFVFWELNADW